MAVLAEAKYATKPNFAYVYFSVKNFTGNYATSSYSFPQTPLTFIPDLGNIPALSGMVISNKTVLWDFGDGETSTEISPTHWYRWPGEYKVGFTVFDNKNNPYRSLYIPTINIKNYVPDGIGFVSTQKFVYDIPASSLSDPIVLVMYRSWQQTHYLSAYGYTVNLYASGAAADYANVEEYYNDKWAHLKSLSRFYERRKFLDTNTEQYIIVDRLSAKDDLLYGYISAGDVLMCTPETENSFVIGSSATAVFYYTDDKPKAFTARSLPVIVFATLDSNKVIDKFTIYNNQYINANEAPYSYSNTSPAAFPIVKVRHSPASSLSISTNGIDGEGDLRLSSFYIPEISFQNTAIPFTVRLKDILNFTTKNYPPIHIRKDANRIVEELPESFDTVYTTLSVLSSEQKYTLLDVGVVKEVAENIYEPIKNVVFYDDFDPDIPRSLGSFYKGYLVPKETSLNCRLTASILVKDPKNFPSDCLLGWIAAPNNTQVIRFFRQFYFDFTGGTLNVSYSAQQKAFNLGNLSDIYSIQVVPKGEDGAQDYQTWFADGSKDQLVKISVQGSHLSSFSLSAMPTAFYNEFLQRDVIRNVDYRSEELGSAAPGSMALNSKNDLWVALFDSVSCIKLDARSGYVKTIALPDVTNVPLASSSDMYNVPILSGFAGDNLLMPAGLDTDRLDNLYVAYSHPVVNAIIKYNTDGKQLSSYYLPWMHQPVEILVDRESFIWVSAINLYTTEHPDLSSKNDYLYKFDSDLNLLNGYPISGFRGIGNLAVDGFQNLWTFHDRETVVRVDRLTNEVTYYPGGSGTNQTSYQQSIGAIAGDTGDYIWVVNSSDAKIYLIDATYPPPPNVSFYNISDLYAVSGTPTHVTSAWQENSYVGLGDFIGQRWVNKYMTKSTLTRVVSGKSNLFNILPLSGQYSIIAKNEDFDSLDFYRQLVYQNILLDKKVLFDTFIGSTLGTLSSTPNTLGRASYAKIANFTDAHADIDRVGIAQLQSYCDEFSINTEAYSLPLPPELRRVVDLCSINHKRLWGEKNQFNEDFDIKQTYTSLSPYGKNLGTEINVLSGTVKTGEPIIARELFTDKFKLVNVPAISTFPYGQIVALSGWNDDWGWGLVTSPDISGAKIRNFYKFYRYKQYSPNEVYGNVIDWANPRNTLNFYNSSFDAWSKDSGIMQSLIAYELTKGLRLFLSGSNIPYNN